MSQSTVPAENQENFFGAMIDEMSAGCDPSKRNEVVFAKLLELNVLVTAKKFFESNLIPDLNKVVVNGLPALLWAVNNKKIDIVELLIDKGADINIKNNNDEALLIIAIKMNDQALVKLLIDKGADINVRKSGNDTALLFAVDKNHQEIVKLLIEKGANLDSVNSNGRTALNQACLSDYIKVAKILVDSGANLDLAEADGDTPLINILRNGRNKNNDEFAKILINKGADVTIENKIQKTAMDYASNDIKKMIEDVIKNKANNGTKLVCIDIDGKEYPCYDYVNPIKMIFQKTDKVTLRLATIKTSECKIKIRKNDQWITDDFKCANMEIQIPNEESVKLEYHVMLDSTMKEIHVKFPSDLIFMVDDRKLGDIYRQPF